MPTFATREPNAPILDNQFKKRLMHRRATSAEKVQNHIMARAKRERHNGHEEAHTYEHWNQFAAQRHAQNRTIHTNEFAQFNTVHRGQYHFIKPKVTYKVRETEKEAGHCKYGTYEEGGRLYCLSNPNHHRLPAGQADPVKRANSLARHHHHAIAQHQAPPPPVVPANQRANNAPAQTPPRQRRMREAERLLRDQQNLPLQGGRERRTRGRGPILG
jgi:hypothetical protein